jgi:fluoroquinolone transport system ATP-binding protein
LIDSPRSLGLQHGKRRVKVEYLGEDTAKQKEFPLKGLGNNAEFLQVLREKEVETIHTEEATLEDIFIKVTGRKLV